MMFNPIRAVHETVKLIRLANEISDRQPGDTPKFGYLLTNRSFLVPAIGLVINILIILNFPILSPILNLLQAYSPELTAEMIIAYITFMSFFWTMIERMFTTAKVVLTRKQAKAALTEVVGSDQLAEALRKAVI